MFENDGLPQPIKSHHENIDGNQGSKYSETHHDIKYLYGHKSHTSAIDGISELWFADTQDWFERFYLKKDSQRFVREDTQKFINFQTTSSIMVSEMRVRRVKK